MKRVLTAVVLVPVVLLLVFVAPLWLFVAAIGIVICVSLREYLALVEATGIKPFRRSTYVLAFLPLALYAVSGLIQYVHPSKRHYWGHFLGSQAQGTALYLMVLGPLFYGISLVFRKDLQGGLSAVAASLFGIPYISLALTLLIGLRVDGHLKFLMLFVLATVWAGDIAAYYVGKNIGKHKLAPIVSPNKSWEGAIASLVVSVVVGVVVVHFRDQVNSWFVSLVPDGFSSGHSTVSMFHVIALGMVTNIAAQFGDLFESALKRGAGVKDSGTLLPGHGGVLDRIDALLFAIPAVWYYATFTSMFSSFYS